MYGVKLSDGSRLRYFMNGHLAFWLCLLACGCGVPTFDANGAGERARRTQWPLWSPKDR